MAGSMDDKPVLAFLYNVRKTYPNPEDLAGQLETDFDDQATIDEISRVLTGLGLDVLGVEADEHAYPVLYQNRRRIQLALNYSIGRYGRARYAQLPAMLEMLRIPYTGSDPLVQAIIQDKSRMQAVLKAHGVPVPPSQLFFDPGQPLAPGLRLPLLVKPVSQGSSAGITKRSLVTSLEELRIQVDSTIRAFGSPALVQEFLCGREFSVPLLGNPPRVLPVIEPDFSRLPKEYPPIDSLEVKWFFEEESSSHHLVCPAEIDTPLRERIEATVQRTWTVLGMRDWCRIDLRSDRDGQLFVLDVNSPPGILPPKISTTSYFPLSARAAGINYEELIVSLLRIAATRSGCALFD